MGNGLFTLDDLMLINQAPALKRSRTTVIVHERYRNIEENNFHGIFSFKVSWPPVGFQLKRCKDFPNIKKWETMVQEDGQKNSIYVAHTNVDR